MCPVPQAELLPGDRPTGRSEHAAQRQIMSRANCVQAQADRTDPRDTAQGTGFSGGGRTNTDLEACPKPRRNCTRRMEQGAPDSDHSAMPRWIRAGCGPMPARVPRKEGLRPRPARPRGGSTSVVFWSCCGPTSSPPSAARSSPPSGSPNASAAGNRWLMFGVGVRSSN